MKKLVGGETSDPQAKDFNRVGGEEEPIFDGLDAVGHVGVRVFAS